jgi:hypothetical protein
MPNDVLVVYDGNGLAYAIFKTASVLAEWNRPYELVFIGVDIYLVRAG